MDIRIIEKEIAGCENSIKEIIKNKDYYTKQYGTAVVENMIAGYEKIIKTYRLITIYR